MYCPRCKGMEKLSTKRTTAGHLKVVREKYCGKCKTSFETVERFDRDIESERAERMGQDKIQQELISDLEDDLQQYDWIFNKFSQAIEKSKNKNAKSGGSS